MQARALSVFILAVLAALFSCTKEKETPAYRVIGEAFAGPNELPIRQDVSLRSPVATTVKHGEKMAVLDRRRRYVQVRTKSQVIGWVDMRLLISQRQMDQLDELAVHHKSTPPMAKATVFDMLNVHTDPNRYSPTFLQIQEKEHFEVIGHRVVVREPFQGDSLDLEDDTPMPAARKKRPKKEPKIPLPSPPPGPKVPENWLELSRTAAEEPPAGKADPKAKQTKLMDDLSLVRTKDGRVGWVLSNAVYLEVPEDVAQYAEGHRITSYFALGEVQDEDKKKNHWLWTTQSQKYAPFEFDGLRVFTYNARRHRYETAYRERGLKGFYPVLADASKPNPEFTIIAEDEAGKLWRKSYRFDGVRVYPLDTQPYMAPKDAPLVSPGGPKIEPGGETSLMDRLKKLMPGK